MANDLDSVSEFRSLLEAAVESFSLEALTKQQLDELVAHYSMMLEWNRHINLTRIIAPGEAARLHYAESLFGGQFIGDAGSVLDIGSGAGFPGVPLAVLRSDVRVTALEANQKKALFLNEVKDTLELTNLNVVRARIEELDRTRYDLLTSRALDRAEDVLKSVATHLRPSQRLMLYCAPDLLATLSAQVGDRFEVEVHPIPHAEARIVAVFARE